MLKVLPIMLKNTPIMLALCFMLSSAYYAENYAGIIDAGLAKGTGVHVASRYLPKIKSNIAIYNCCIKVIVWLYSTHTVYI